MSAVFEGVLVPRTANASRGDLQRFCAARLGGIAVGYAALDDDVAVLVGPDELFSEKFNELGAVASREFGKALVVRYDSRIGHRSSYYFEGGFERASFGEEDEIWSPLDENRRVTAVRLSPDELDDDEDAEYQTLENAIELGLERFGMGDWGDLFFLIYNQEDLVDFNY